MPGVQRSGEDARIAGGAGGRHRFRAQPLRTRAIRRVVELDRQSRLQPRSRRLVRGGGERFVEARDRLPVEIDDRDAEAGEPERGVAQQRRVAATLRERACRAERGTRGRAVPRPQQRFAAGEQQRAGIVLVPRQLECLECPIKALGSVLVGEPVERATSGAREQLRGEASVARGGGGEPVRRDLLEMTVLAGEAR
ncbi:MAG: hypothetical protein QOK21_1775 [Solirubrobacteraceae bacterium]|nr:hypothetical protein [Solirubrobacteraceae bacterium]